MSSFNRAPATFKTPLTQGKEISPPGPIDFSAPVFESCYPSIETCVCVCICISIYLSIYLSVYIYIHVVYPLAYYLHCFLCTFRLSTYVDTHKLSHKSYVPLGSRGLGDCNESSCKPSLSILPKAASPTCQANLKRRQASLPHAHEPKMKPLSLRCHLGDDLMNHCQARSEFLGHRSCCLMSGGPLPVLGCRSVLSRTAKNYREKQTTPVFALKFLSTESPSWPASAGGPLSERDLLQQGSRAGLCSLRLLP